MYGLFVCVWVIPCLLTAESLIDDAAAVNVGRARDVDADTVLDEVLVDAVEGGAGALELGDDGELLGGVDGLARAVEVRVSVAEGVQIAPVGVAVAGVPVFRVGAAAGLGLTDEVLVGLAGVRGERERLPVRLPQVHLSAARAEVANTGVLVGLGGRPTLAVTLLSQLC